MLGKGAVISVIGFAIAFSVYQLKMSGAMINASVNFNQEYAETLLQHAKSSAMNIGINKAWDENWLTGAFDLVVETCSTQVIVTQVGLDTIKIKTNAWTYTFDEDEFYENQKTLRLTDSVIAFFKYRTPVSQFFWFTIDEGNVYWTSKDTVWGPMHTNGLLRVDGAPTFYGKVSAKLGITPLPTDPSNQANYFGGYEIGIQNDVNTDMAPLISAATAGNGASPMNTKSLYDKEVTFDFQPDGSIIRTVETDPPDTLASLADLAPTGVVYSTEDIHVKGIFDGEMSIYTAKDIIIDDDIVYFDDPVLNPLSDDLLGLIAGNDIIIADNVANNSDVNINAALMAVNGSFTAENYASRAVAGQLKVVGSIFQNIRGPIGTFNWSTNTVLSGFEKNYRFDDRLQSTSPPYYPYVRNLQLIAWWE